jgi:hypothetical protein
MAANMEQVEAETMGRSGTPLAYVRYRSLLVPLTLLLWKKGVLFASIEDL